ncbi:hypothetical protein V6N11_071734 [Hibiscus sabdariffa]|uniref:RNase H type-1 domain-containing protein n=1 Tax=Hibiscus sabdariffa TaxID=183260 RepID=A0ABR2U1G4_9ROSI
MMLFEWRKPPEGWWKLNSDGATASGSGLSSCDDVVRDEDGKWLIGFAQRIGICSIVEAELWAVYEALNTLMSRVNELLLLWLWELAAACCDVWSDICMAYWLLELAMTLG